MQGATLDNPIGILFKAYLMVPCYNFKTYIGCQHEDYLDRKLTGLTHKSMMASAKHKFGFLKIKSKWRAKSPDN
jgi:hypothetical protein